MQCNQPNSTKILTFIFIRDGKRRAFVFGLTWGFSNAIIFYAYAANYGAGAYFISQDLMEFNDVFRYIINKTFLM